MFSKWRIKGIDGYRFDELGNLWRLPYTDYKGKSRGLRMLKMHYPSRWKINGEYYSKNQLRNRLELDTEPIELIIKDQMPF
jgi:predicted GTPase